MGVNVYPTPANPSNPDKVSRLITSGSITTTPGETTVYSNLPAGYYAVGSLSVVPTSAYMGLLGFRYGTAFYGALSSAGSNSSAYKTTSATDLILQKYWSTRQVHAQTPGAFIYGDGKYISSVGASGTTIYYNTGEPDTVWTSATLPSNGTLYAGAYGAGETNKYVFAGFSSYIVTSTDAITWTSRTAATSATMRVGIYGNGTYVFGGANGVSQLSTDGVTWTLVTSPNNNNNQINAGMYYNGKYIFVHNDNLVTHSTDGVTWTSVTTPASATTDFNGIEYGAGKYVVVGSENTIVTSTDLVTWTTRDCNPSSTTDLTFAAIVYGGGKFWVPVRSGGTSSNWDNFRTSTDGITWDKYYMGGSSQTISGNQITYVTSPAVQIGGSQQIIATPTTSGIESSYYLYEYDL